MRFSRPCGPFFIAFSTSRALAASTLRVAARYRGVRTVEYDGKRVTYASDGEMSAALADLNRQIAGATERISVVRIQSSKGL